MRISSIADYLQRPYPMLGYKDIRFKMTLFFSLFVFLFLFVFRPFGIQGTFNEVLLIAAGYGMVTFIIMLLNNYLLPLLIPNFFNPDKWVIYKTFLINFWFIFTISIGNYLYDFYLICDKTNEYNLFSYVGITLAVGLFPMTVLTMFFERKFNKLSEVKITEMNQRIVERKSPKKTTVLNFVGQGQNEILNIMPNDIILIKSEGNYCDFFIRTEVGFIKRTLRISIKNVEQETDKISYIMRIHRSYIVNIKHIARFSGNARNLIVYMNFIDLDAPVSRSYEREVTNALHNM